ncbi:hypothetical protein jhhlp_003029 [Lomentospora prolificans]|uniref:Uncharacterized protein n=1 Tax=Lomentospora prolificans TaxID=41688 RepID=A0A2N3NFU3_9PEZI|nr:hypothetical protein jhhlp_003029 [Lomentospora prolificans]
MTGDTPTPLVAEGPTIPSVSCAKNIALLRFLHEIPELPTRNQRNRVPFRDEDYQLPFDRERQLAGILAFLSRVKDDPYRVPAISLQECPKGRSVNVLIAVNRKSAADGKVAVQKIADGFQRIFEPLRGAGKDDDYEVRDRVFDAIVPMCWDRIVERLSPDKSWKASEKKKKPIKELLQNAIKALRNNNKVPVSSRAAAKEFLERARAALRQVSAWDNHRVVPEMKALIRKIHSLKNVPEFARIVALVPNGVQLEYMVTKVSRYLEAAKYLSRTAMKYPIARRMVPVAVDLPATILNEKPSQDVPADIDTTLNRLHQDKKSRKAIYRLLEVREENAQPQFHKYFETALNKVTVHAEIQILAYCDLNGRGRYPRVVCSSKKACYLCNQFITLHGKIYTPYCHGKLYIHWRLPNFPSRDMKLPFSARLEQVGMKSLKTMHRENKRIKHPDPTESACHTLLLSTTTLSGGSSTSDSRDESERAEATSFILAESGGSSRSLEGRHSDSGNCNPEQAPSRSGDEPTEPVLGGECPANQEPQYRTLGSLSSFAYSSVQPYSSIHKPEGPIETWRNK